MHKNWIQKYQYPSGGIQYMQPPPVSPIQANINSITQDANKKLQQSVQNSLVAGAYNYGKQSNKIGNIIQQGLGILSGYGSSSDLLSNISGNFKPSGFDIAGLGMGLVNTGLDMFGVKRTDSSRETTADKALGFMSKLPLKYIPGVGTAVDIAVKGLKTLSDITGRTADKQGTEDMSNIGYNTEVSELAGTKESGLTRVTNWIGKLFTGKDKSKHSKINRKTDWANQFNLQASDASYQHRENNLAATNSMQDLLAKNQQALMGGVNLNILAAKKGAKINPAQLRTLVKKAKKGTKLQKISFEDWYNTVPKDRNDTTSYNLRRAYELAPREELEKWRTATPEQLKDTTYHLKTFYWNDAGIGEFVKSKKHDTIQKEIDWYYSDKAKDFRNKYTLFDDDSDYYQYRPIEKFAEGGKMNVIPEGALHARKHNLPEEIAEKVTNKGIPVITLEEGGDIKQHAEIEVNEIIFNKETTDKLEDFFKKYNNTEDSKEKDLIAVEAGKFLASEILENTSDNTGLLNTIQ